MPNPTQPLQTLLAQNVRQNKPDTTVVPARFSFYSPLELYQRFEVTGLNFKGQASSGYAEVGWDVEVGWTGELDLSVFFPPAACAGQFQAKLVVSGESTKSTVLVIQRWPKQIAIPTNDAGTETTSWRTNKPISFLALAPKVANSSNKKSLGLGVGIDATFGPPIGTIKGLGGEDFFTGDNTVTMGWFFNIQGQVKVSWVSMVDIHPGFYRSPASTALADNFAKTLGPAKAKTLKQEIYNWLKHLTAQGAKSIDEAYKSGKLTPDNRKKAKEAMQTLNQLGDNMASGTKVFGQIVSALGGGNVLTDSLSKSLTNFATWQESGKSLNEFIKTLTNYQTYLKQELVSFRSRMDGRGVAVLQQQLEQTQGYIKRLRDLQSFYGETPVAYRQPIVKPSNLPFAKADKLSYMSMITTEGSIGGKTGPKLVVPFFGQVLAAGSAQATVGVAAEGKFSNYRFQSVAADTNKKLLICTQDTHLSYSQVTLSAQASIDFAVFQAAPSYGASGSAMVLNVMDYSSVVAYWLYPEGTEANPVLVGDGSGIRFGCSVLLKRLLSYWKDPSSSDSKKLEKALLNYLSIRSPMLRSFLAELNLPELAKLDLPASLLIETCFAFPRGFKINLRKKSDGRFDPVNLLGTPKVIDFIGAQRLNRKIGQSTPRPPQAIRLRLRLADQLDRSDTKFKLGLWINAVPGINLKPIEQAGYSGIIDLFTWFVPAPERGRSDYNTAPVLDPAKPNPTPAEPTKATPETVGRAALGYERTVPAVVIIHQ